MGVGILSPLRACGRSKPLPYYSYESLIKALNGRACLRRLKPFFEEGFKNPKNFKKGIIEDTGGKQVPQRTSPWGPYPIGIEEQFVCKVLVMEGRASGGLNPSLKKGLRIPRTSKKELLRIQEENRCHRGHHHGAPTPLVLKSNLYARFWLWKGVPPAA
ncbi:MAG: hypothetical protein E7610_08965 [Ruminococcaceae bacterium]|nr:hypothetical protein [Oscillospiraceae bacterium]